MDKFRKAIFDLLAEDQDLSGAEKYLVGEVVDRFVQDHRRATGEDPPALFGTRFILLLQDWKLSVSRYQQLTNGEKKTWKQ